MLAFPLLLFHLFVKDSKDANRHVNHLTSVIKNSSSEKTYSQPLNLIFFGLDKTHERENTMGSFRTDTIVVMQLDMTEPKIDMLSIPRDSYVYIPLIKRMDKINHAFSLAGGETGKGFTCSVDTIENLLGIPVHHYIGMDMEAIEPVVDAAGGVEFTSDIDLITEDCYLIKGEKQHFTGLMAYHYVQYRGTEYGDIDRIARQQKFLQAFFTQIKDSQKLLNIFGVYDDIKSMTYSDMTLPQIISLAYRFNNITAADIDSFILEGDFMNKDGISYWKPDLELKERLINEHFAE